MKLLEEKAELNRASISKTGYRALFILRLLLESPKTREELQEAFSHDEILKKDFHKDTVTNTVNALRKAGCDITRPNSRIDYRYVLNSHPFSIKIKDLQVKYLQDLRKGIISFGNWEDINALNNFYAKIAKFAGDEQTEKELIHNRPLKNIDERVFADIVRYARSKQTVNVIYNSPKNGIEPLKFIPDFLEFNNDKLYLWGYSFKYENIGYLRADKIKSIHVIDFAPNNYIFDSYLAKVPKVRYLLKGYSAHVYWENPRENIVRKSKDEILIEARVYNEFNFMQKILSYGEDCRIISPDDYKEKIVQLLKEIKAGYKNDE